MNDTYANYVSLMQNRRLQHQQIMNQSGASSIGQVHNLLDSQALLLHQQQCAQQNQQNQQQPPQNNMLTAGQRAANYYQQQQQLQALQSTIPGLPRPFGGTILGRITVSPSMSSFIGIPAGEARLLQTYFAQLSRCNQDILRWTHVFNFQHRPRLQADGQGSMTREAEFFATKLRASETDLDSRNIFGLRCNFCCGDASSYVPGSSTFITRPGMQAMQTLLQAIRRRREHAAVCPGVSNIAKISILGYVETEEEKKKLLAFLKVWWAIMSSAKCFKTTPDDYFPNSVPVPFNRQPNGMIGTPTNNTKKRKRAPTDFLPVVEDDRPLCSGLLDAIADTKQMAKGSKVFFDDLSQSMVGEMEDVGTEAVSQSFGICLSKRTDGWDANIYCKSCGLQPGRAFLKVSGRRVEEDTALNVWRYILEHVDNCHSATVSTKRIFKRRAQQGPTANFCNFWKSWHNNLVTTFTPTVLALRERANCDYYRPMTQQEARKVKRVTWVFSEQERTDRSPKSIIVGNDLYRNSKGNRQMRNFISQHRALFTRLSEEQQTLMIELVVEGLLKRGLVFEKSNANGTFVECCEAERLQYVKRAMEDGFPTLLRPQLAPGSKSKVLLVENAVSVGILYGGHSDTTFRPPRFGAENMPRMSLGPVVRSLMSPPSPVREPEKQNQALPDEQQPIGQMSVTESDQQIAHEEERHVTAASLQLLPSNEPGLDVQAEPKSNYQQQKARMDLHTLASLDHCESTNEEVVTHATDIDSRGEGQELSPNVHQKDKHVEPQRHQDIQQDGNAQPPPTPHNRREVSQCGTTVHTDPSEERGEVNNVSDDQERTHVQGRAPYFTTEGRGGILSDGQNSDAAIVLE